MGCDCLHMEVDLDPVKVFSHVSTRTPLSFSRHCSRCDTRDGRTPAVVAPCGNAKKICYCECDAYITCLCISGVEC